MKAQLTNLQSANRVIYPREDKNLYETAYKSNIAKVTPYPLYITFDNRGGNGITSLELDLATIVASQVEDYDVREHIAEPTMEGNLFWGWYTSPDVTNINYMYFPGALAKDFTLYARWQDESQLVNTWETSYKFTINGEEATITGSKDSIKGLATFVIPYKVLDENDATISYVVKAIAAHAFQQEKYLNYVEFAEDSELAEIGEFAFSSVVTLRKITLPESLTTLGREVFAGCLNLEEIAVKEGNLNFASENGILYNADKTTVLCVPASFADVSLAESCTTIGPYAFDIMPNLTKFTLGGAIKTVKQHAFYNCESLTSLVIGPSVETFEDGALNEFCKNINAVVIEGIASQGTRSAIPYITRDFGPSAWLGKLNVYVPELDIRLYDTSEGNNYNLITYAENAQIFTLKLHYNDAENTVLVLTVVEGTTMPAVTKPYKLGYIWNGWFVMDGVDVTDIKFEDDDVIESNLELAAVFEAKVYSIIYHLNGGSHEESEYYDPDEDTFTVEFTLNSFGDDKQSVIEVLTTELTGYNFIGWYTNSEFDSAKVTEIKYGLLTLQQIEDVLPIELYAKWEVKTFVISFTEHEGYTIGITEGVLNPTPWDSTFTFFIEYKTGYTQNSPANVSVVITDESGTKTTLVASIDGGIGYYTIENVKEAYFVEITGVKINVYTVSFEEREVDVAYSQSENMPQSITIEHGKSLNDVLEAELDMPEKVGYIFTGWHRRTRENNVDKYDANTYNFDAAVIDDVMLFAYWDVIYYDITYVLDGGTISTDTSLIIYTRYTIEDTVILPLESNVNKAGYNFEGWFENVPLGADNKYIFDGLTKTIAFNAGNTGDKTFVAKWEIIHYTIAYNTNGGELKGLVKTEYTIEDQIELPSDTTVESVSGKITSVGHTFKGWFMENGNSIGVISKGTTGNLLLTAQWQVNTYSITYVLNGSAVSEVRIYGGTVSSEINEYVSSYEYSNDIVILPTTASVSRTGYSFGGWYTDTGFTNPASEISARSIGDKTYYAKWTATDYRIELDVDAGEITGTSSYLIEENNKYYLKITYDAFSTPQSTISIPTAERGGYYFKGWFDEDSVKVNNINLTNIDKLNKITVQWSTKSFVLNWDNKDIVRLLAAEDSLIPVYGGSIKFVVDFIDLKYNKSNITLAYTMSGEEHELEKGEDYYEIDDIDGDIYVTISGIELNKYNIIFNTIGGSEVATVQVEHGQAITKPADPTRAGYTFGAWYKDTSYLEEKKYDFSTLVERDYTLYASWDIVTYSYTVTSNVPSYDYSKTGTYNVETLYTFGESDRFDIPGYTFQCWKLGDKVIHNTNGLTGQLNIEATYTINHYTITYAVDHGQSNNEVTEYTIEKEDILLHDATKTGFRFNGWKLENDPGTVHIVERDNNKYLAKGSYGDITLTAQFKLNSEFYYGVTFKVDNLIYTERAVLISSGYFEDKVEGPIKEGQEFKGWFLSDGSLKTPIDFDTYKIEGDITLIGKYDALPYDVTYDYGEVTGVTNNNPAQIWYSDKVYELLPASKEGYTFNGWYSEPTYENKVTTITRLTKNITLYADIRKTVYHITYFLNGGENSAYNPTEYTIDSAEITLKPATKKDYNFLGWYDGLNNEVQVIKPTDLKNYIINAEFKIKDDFKKITYLYNTGTEVILEGEVTWHKNDIVQLEQGRDIRGMEFKGWYLDDGSFNIPYDISEPITEDKKVYAKYDLRDYSITYSYNKNILPDNPNEDVRYTVKSRITLKPAMKEGYNFLGWYVGEEKKEVIQDDIGDLNLVGRFEAIRYTVTYRDGQEEIDSGTNVKEYTVERIERFTSVSKTGYNFVKWVDDAGEEISSTEGRLGDLNLYATYTLKEYEIVYILDDVKVGTVENRNSTKYTVETDRPLLTPIAKGYTFNGWYKGDEEISEISHMESGGFFLTGRFTPIEYSIQYVTKEGETHTNPTRYTIESGNIRLSDAYGETDFIGWKIGEEYISNIDPTRCENITLVAVFEEPVKNEMNMTILIIGIAGTAVASIAIMSIIMAAVVTRLKRKKYSDISKINEVIDKLNTYEKHSKDDTKR